MAGSRSMVFYESWLALARRLPDPKDAIFQLIEYGIDGKEFHPEDDLTAMFLDMAKPNIDYNAKMKRGGAPEGNTNAKGHGAPRGNKNAKKKQTTKTNNPSDVDGDVDVDGDISSGDTSPLDAGSGPAGPDWDQLLAQINAEGGGDDDE